MRTVNMVITYFFIAVRYFLSLEIMTYYIGVV